MRFASEAFDDALIGSTIIIAERCAEEQERGENRVKYLKIRDRMDLESAASLVEREIDSDKTIVSDEYWLLAATQETIDTDTSWSLYYDTPPVYFELQTSDDMCELQEVANLYKGKKVGGNDYFYRRSEEWEELGLDEFTYPVIKATGQIEKIRFDDHDAEEWGVLDVRNLVREALNTDQKFGDDNLTHVKKWLKKNGYTDLLEYIQQGEKQDQHEHSSCESRDVWFNIDDLDQYVSCMAMGEFLWTHHRIAWNEADALVDYQFHCIDPAEGVTDKLLGGILNSRVTWLTRELEGRQASGASMTRARMTLYEAEEMSIVDPRQLDEEDKQRIITAFESLMQAEEQVDEPDENQTVSEARDELDFAVLSGIGEEKRLEDIQRAVERIVAVRANEGSENTEVLIDREQDREEIELSGVKSARETKTLDDYN